MKHMHDWPGKPTWVNGSTVTTATGVIDNSTKPRDITIKPMANGYCLDIGCKTFVFESLDNLLYRVYEYYTNPAKVELHFESTNKLPVILSKKPKSVN